MSVGASFLWVALGGAGGSCLRHAMTLAFARWDGNPVIATFACNALGSFLIGSLAGWSGSEGNSPAPMVRPLLIVGFCGGFTTFSSFSLQTYALLESGRWGPALWNVLGSFATCLAATVAGYRISSN